MKQIGVTDGKNEVKGTTRATTERGYIKAAKRLWPYTGLHRVRIVVWDDGQGPGYDPRIYEIVIDIN